MDTRDFVVAIPALNEEETIDKVIQEIKRIYPNISIVVINDGSTDKTSSIAAEAGATVINMPFNVGVGGAMQTAFQFALESNFEYLIQFDADGQHDSSSIQRLIDASLFSDVVVGTRFNDESKMRMSPIRKLAVGSLRIIVRKAIRVKISDPTSGFRIANKKAMLIYAEKYPTSYLGDTVGSLIVAGQHNLKVGEVDVVMHPRQGGNASQNWIKLPIHLIRVAIIGVIFLFDLRVILRRK